MGRPGGMAPVMVREKSMGGNSIPQQQQHFSLFSISFFLYFFSSNT
jgi:hypothetical protein